MDPSHSAHLREQIAASAARLIAEDGLDYAGAKRRAAREVVGRDRADCMPDNAEVEAAVREHQALFMADTQPARLHALRLQAADVLRFFAGHGLAAHASGAIVNGTAGEHSDIHLRIVDDNAKDIEILLLNAGIDFDVTEGDGTRAGGETLTFLWPPRKLGGVPHRGPVDAEEVHLAIVDPRDRAASAGLARADLAGLEALIAAASDGEDA